MSGDQLKPLIDASAIEQAPRERLPVAGFMPRAGAFLIDCFALWFISNGIATYAWDAAYPHRMLWQALMLIGLFAYFIVGASRATDGRTLGKALLKIQTVGQGGEPLAWSRAAARGALVALMVLSWSVLRGHVWLPQMRLMHVAFLLGLGAVAVGYALAASIYAGQHPKKMALHDIAAGSMVAYRGDVGVAGRFVSDWTEAERAKLGTTKWATVVTVAVMLGFFAKLIFGNFGNLQKQYALVDAASREIDVPGFHLVYFGGPSPETQKQVREYYARRLEQAASQGELGQSGAADAATTLSLTADALTSMTVGRLEVVGREMLYIFDCDTFYTTDTLTALPEYRQLRRQLVDASRFLSAQHFVDENGAPYPYERILFQFTGTMPLVLSGRRRFIYLDGMMPDGTEIPQDMEFTP